jgi:two-component system, NtrC family, response regulator HupR/HoxA
VRELMNEMQRMVALAEAPIIGPELLSPRIRHRQPAANASQPQGQSQSLREQLDVLEARILAESLQRHHWNISRVAEELALSRVGLRAKLARHGLERPD